MDFVSFRTVTAAAALILAAGAAADTTIAKKPDIGNWWNPLGNNGATPVYADMFIAPGGDTQVSSIGTWLDDVGTGGVNLRFEVWGDNGGPDYTKVVASTGTVSPQTGVGLGYNEYKVSGTLTPGKTYWFVATAVGEKGDGIWQVGGHTQNSDGIVDNGTFWYSNDPSGQFFDGQNLTPEMAFVVNLTTGGANYYLRSEAGQPWGESTNEDAMTMVFGGDWVNGTFESQDPNVLFSDATKFIYIDGSDNGAEEFAKFIAANQSAMEKWVAGGGALLLNSAPNEGGSFDLGFGQTLAYAEYGAELHVVDPSHPVANGPFTPAGADYTGNSSAHAYIKGDSDTIANNEFGNPTIKELSSGGGHVVFGGLTTDNFWEPQPNAHNFRANLISYASRAGGEECYADFTGDGALDLFDFLAFVNAFNALDPRADCDHDSSFTLFDFLCYTNAFNAGC